MSQTFNDGELWIVQRMPGAPVELAQYRVAGGEVGWTYFGTYYRDAPEAVKAVERVETVPAE